MLSSETRLNFEGMFVNNPHLEHKRVSFSLESSNSAPKYPPNRKTSAPSSMGVMRMSSYMDDVDSDLIYQEIQKLSGLSKIDRIATSLPAEDTALQISELGNLNIRSKKKPLLKSVMSNLSPRLSKKVRESEVRMPSPNPVWPNSMTTFSRGVSVSNTPPTIVSPAEVSLTALRVQAQLDESKYIREGFNCLRKPNGSCDLWTESESENADEAILENPDIENNNEYNNKGHQNNSKLNHTSVNPSTFHYYGQSPFDDDFDPSIHKPNVYVNSELSASINQEFNRTQNDHYFSNNYLLPSNDARGHFYKEYLHLDEGPPVDSVFV